MFPNQNQQPTYEADYLDRIAPGPEKPKFFSGSFGKIFILMIVLFLFAVGIIINMQGKDKTGSTVKVFLTVEAIDKVIDQNESRIQSGNLENYNSNFNVWLANTKRETADILKQAGVIRAKYNKEDVAAAKKLGEDLNYKLEEAYFGSIFDEVYAHEMASQMNKISILLDDLVNNPPGKPFKDLATNATTNLEPIYKSFKEFDPTLD